MSPDGVGCESCHGASGRWLGPHTTVGWKDGKDSAAKQELGLQNTKDLVRRAEVCAGCHIGQRGQPDLIDRDVNHDLIAAGHPRLNFEFAAYLDKLPSHWIEKGVNADPGNRNKRAPEFSARAWALGQLVTAKTALELSRGRAAGVAAAKAPSAPLPLPGPSSARPPWPEFAEYGCFSCHHSLADEAWRRDRRAPGVGLVPPAWGSWYLPMTAALLQHPAVGAGGESQDFQAVLQQLVKEMSRPIPDAAVVERLADQCVKVLERLIEALPTRPASARLFDATGVEQLIDLFDRRESWDKVRSWDEATQRYLALVPLGQAWAKLAPARKADQDRLEAHEGAALQAHVSNRVRQPERFRPWQVSAPPGPLSDDPQARAPPVVRLAPSTPDPATRGRSARRSQSR